MSKVQKIYNILNKASVQAIHLLCDDISDTFDVNEDELNKFRSNPKKRKKTGYTVYSKKMSDEIRENDKDIKFGKLNTMIGTGWRNLSAEEVEKYENEAIELNNNDEK